MAGPSPISSNLTSTSPSFKNISALRIKYTVLIPKGLAQFVFNPAGALLHSSSLLVHFRPTIPVSDLESKAHWKGKAATIPSTFNAFLPICLTLTHPLSHSFSIQGPFLFLKKSACFSSPLILWIFSLQYLSHCQIVISLVDTCPSSPPDWSFLVVWNDLSYALFDLQYLNNARYITTC